ncbi:hypothetical protein [Sulfurimonas sp.]
MFEFLDSDWFNISLQIVFLILISYDVKKYRKTKKREYIINIVLTVGFAIWTLYPYYNSYVGWEDEQKVEMLSNCKGDENSTKLCKCIDDATFKNYTYLEYKDVDKNSSDYAEFLNDAKEDCLDSSWF